MSLRPSAGIETPKSRPRALLSRIVSFVLVLLFMLFSGAETGGFSASGRVLASDSREAAGTDLYSAIRQTAYSYYRRGPWIQYNSMKARKAYFSPEEATSQNINYTVCSSFIQNVYYDMLGIAIPPYTDSLLSYAQKYIGGPEVVLYGETHNDSNHMRVYSEEKGRTVRYQNMATSQLLPYLKSGDILVYTGHAMMVYDLVYSENGHLADAKVIESGHGYNNVSVNTKISGKTRMGSSISFGNSNHLLYYTSRQNTDLADGRLEGSVHLSTLKTSITWGALSTSRRDQYAVLRFLREDSGDIILTYHGEEWGEKDYDAVAVELTEKARDRLRYPEIYIEKTVDAFADSAVDAGGELNYLITVTNESDADYADDLYITENISEYAEFDSYITSGQRVSSVWNGAENSVCWNIGKLHRGETVLIKYRTLVKESAAGNRIESIGTVGHISSSTVCNPVQVKTPEGFSAAIEEGYEALKGSFSGLELIDRIYERAAGAELGLKDLQINKLVKNRRTASIKDTTVLLNKWHALYGAVLHSYWGALASSTYAYKDKTIYSYDLKYWRSYGDLGRRADTVYEENFRTGDVLIYSNSKDFVYLTADPKHPARRTYITRENGVYAYVFIEGRGFLGINFGADGAMGTKDDRNDFTPEYYRENDLPLYSDPNVTDESMLRFANYQTLFGKDCYVVLRPSQILFAPPEPVDDGGGEADVPAPEVAEDTPGGESEGADDFTRDPRAVAAAFVLLLASGFCICLFILDRNRDRNGH